MGRDALDVGIKLEFCDEKMALRGCDYIYDEAEGVPEEGIAPGIRFEDLPESWTCPDCGAAKSEFVVEGDD